MGNKKTAETKTIKAENVAKKDEGPKLFIDPKLTPQKEIPQAKKQIVRRENGKVAQIKSLAKEGKTVKEIIAMGYNKNTVYRRFGEYHKERLSK